MNTNTTPLLSTLIIIKQLSMMDASSSVLRARENISEPTLKRYIAEARTMGAKIESVKFNGKWFYRLTNASEVMTRVLRWIDLEEKRDLIEQA